MLRRTLTAVLVLVLALPALVSSREPPRPWVDRCADDGGRTLTANRWVRVYVRRDRLDSEYLRYCWVPTGGATTLVASGGSATAFVPHYRIAGRYLGTARIDFDRKQPIYPGVDLTVAVRDVKRPRCVTGFRAQPPHSESWRYDDREPGVTDLELTSQGALAWIASGAPNRDDYFYVQKADGAGRAVLDEGPAIDPRSLAISGRRIYWTNAGEPRTAVLDGRARTAVCP